MIPQLFCGVPVTCHTGWPGHSVEISRLSTPDEHRLVRSGILVLKPGAALTLILDLVPYLYVEVADVVLLL